MQQAIAVGRCPLCFGPTVFGLSGTVCEQHPHHNLFLSPSEAQVVRDRRRELGRGLTEETVLEMREETDRWEARGRKIAQYVKESEARAADRLHVMDGSELGYIQRCRAILGNVEYV